MRWVDVYVWNTKTAGGNIVLFRIPHEVAHARARNMLILHISAYVERREQCPENSQ